MTHREARKTIDSSPPAQRDDLVDLYDSSRKYIFFDMKNLVTIESTRRGPNMGIAIPMQVKRLRLS